MTQRYKLDGGSSTSRISRNPAQTSAWSSASATVIIAVAGGAGGRVPRSRRATITCREGSAEQGRPFPHAGQAVTGRRGAVGAASWTVVLDDDVDGRRRRRRGRRSRTQRQRRRDARLRPGRHAGTGGPVRRNLHGR